MYNIFKDARSVQNSDYCRFDSLDGYSTNFTVDGDVDGWDVFYNIYLYGSWRGTLVGNIRDNGSYISRSNPFIPIDGSDFYYIRLMMKYTVYDEKHRPTKGKIQWTKIDDNVWDDSKEIEFDIITDDKWHLYEINAGPKTKWRGLINNLRIYPAIDGHYRDKFAISFIKISSSTNYRCSNPQCSYYNSYKHPCPGAGRRGYIIAGEAKSNYTTISGVNDELIININDYGDVKFNLGTHKNLTGIEAAKLLSNTISSYNIGSYAYAFCEYNEDNKLVIYSGSKGDHSKVSVSGTAAEAFGFSTYEAVGGKKPASGFDYASSRMLTSLEINRLIDGNYDDFAYVHNSDQFNVEAGRRDFNQISPSQLIEGETQSYYHDFVSKHNTIVDLSHPINNNGILNVIYVSGIATESSKIKILRPKANGDLEVVYTLDFPEIEDNYLYTTRPNVYRIDCNVLVEKGDLIGVYDVNLYVGKNLSDLPDATFLIFTGDIEGVASRDDAQFYSFGLGGFAIYARSNRRQNNVILDFDLGELVNVETVDIFGKEDSDYFEYNVALCLDVNWDVDLFNETHYHTGFNWWSGQLWSATHQNIAYGIECLDDGIVTADNGQLGTIYTDNGIATHGPHSYFYVNGDAEWLYSSTCDGKHEFCWPNVPDQDGYALSFERDPIAFTLNFPDEMVLDIHKSIIYFKERNNFRHLELSYYMGFNGYGGNTYDPRYNRIPEYTLIKVDGLPQYNTDDYPSAKYLYNNPMDDTVYYREWRGTDAYNPINPDIAKSAAVTDWLVLEHNFDPIECKGFRIYTHKHYSTKLTEIEVYSRMFMSASLLDNIILSFSSYGDIWNTAEFERIDDNHISAFIGGSPRYFRLELIASGKFYLNEVSAFVGDQVKLDDCTDNVLLEEAQSNKVNSAFPFTITNVYGKSLDLSIDIPKEIFNTNDVLFWSKLDSQESLDTPQIGPKSLLYKYDDYEIRNANGQCAINVPAYGLKNLIDGKKAYYSYNGEDFYSWGTVSSGISINFDNYEYSHLKKAVIKFDSVSARYWKILKNNDAGFAVHDIECYYNSARVNISGVYGRTDGALSKQERFVECDGVNLPSFFIYDLIKGEYLPIIWNVRPDYWCVNTSSIYKFGASASRTSITLTSDRFDPVSDFEMSFVFYYRQILDGYSQQILISLYDSLDSIIFQYKEYSVNSTTKYQELYDGTAKIYNSDISSVNGKHTMIRFKREGSNLKFFMNGVLMYDGVFNADMFSYVTIYFHSYGSELTPSSYSNNALYFLPYIGLDANLFHHGVGFALPSSLPIDEIHLKYVGNTPQNLDIYVSNTNTDDYVYWSSITPFSEDDNFYLYFVLDLEKRHDLGIIRNYGELPNKLWVSINENTEYSNIDSPDITSLMLNNSDYYDARWTILKLLCGDGQLRVIDKIGIYPNIETVFCKGGGYNCEWQAFNTLLSDYARPRNVAYQATVTGTNLYSLNFHPTNAVDGVSTKYSMDACWGFEKTESEDPYLELDFGQTHRINKVVLYHGYNTADDNYMNNDYTISVSPTVTGSFTQIVSITNNSDFYREHEFTPLEVRKLRLTITNYTSAPAWFYNEEDNSYELFNGSFLREIEVYTVQDETHINSEDWPVVCMNLLDQFNITDHQLINNLENNNDNWDNAEMFFKYSDDLFDDPKKVSFTQEGDYKIQYQKIDSSGNMAGQPEYIFDDAVYFDEGNYYVEWDSYEANLENEVSLRLEGSHVVDDFADLIGSGWIHQIGSITVPESGFYSVKAIRHIGGDIGSSDANWGARNPIIYRPVGLKKWIAVTRDTATNYSWDDDSNKYGKDYLSLIQVFGDTKYNPTEYHWWWKSGLSILSNNGFIVKKGKRSLQINYPASSGTDVIEFIEGDTFGQDNNFSIKDFLTFWVYIEDVSKLDLGFGDLTFGIINDTNAIYYGWNLDKFNLINGWNCVRLKFEEYDFIYPARSEFDTLGDYLYEDLNFRNNEKEFTSIRLRYRGVGEEFVWYLDSFKIERNKFDDDVKFGKGLYLTGKEYLEIPISNINLEKGAIEFYLKLNTDSLGIDIFNQIASRPLFSLLNNNNEIVSLSIKSASWFDVTVGDIRKELQSFNVDFTYLTSNYMFGRDSVVHLALVWDNEGIYMDNGDTIRLYVNGRLICASKTKWEVTDTKSVLLKLGGSMPINALNHDCYCDTIFHNVKIYNYCKTDFDIEAEGIDKEELIAANDFLEISVDGINFYGVGSDRLPIVFREVNANESRTIYIRANKKGIKSMPFYDASLLIDWTMPV